MRGNSQAGQAAPLAGMDPDGVFLAQTLLDRVRRHAVDREQRDRGDALVVDWRVKAKPLDIPRFLSLMILQSTSVNYLEKTLTDV